MAEQETDVIRFQKKKKNRKKFEYFVTFKKILFISRNILIFQHVFQSYSMQHDFIYIFVIIKKKKFIKYFVISIDQ